MASVNKVILVGNLGRDPEVRYMPNGEAVCNFSIATTENWKDKSGVKQEKTEWHNITAWRGLAETCANYLKKGSRVYLEGRLETDSWEDENKKKHYKTKVLIDELIMLDSKGASSASGTDGGGETVSKGSVKTTVADDDDLPF